MPPIAGALLSMARIALCLEYDGSAFCGWQVQKEGRSVQATLEHALSRVAASDVRTTCAGRTDAGVHAFSQVVHFDTEAVRTPRSWVLGTNTELPADVNVRWAMEVGEEFHARFDARSRTYRYLVSNRPVRSSLWRNRAWTIYQELDLTAMRHAATHFLGEHDFSALRAAGCQAKSAVRTIHKLEVNRRGHWLSIEVCANAFLQHMVRNIVGVLVRVGRGDADPEWAAQVIDGRDRTRGGVTAPAAGLYLTGVDYPRAFALPPSRAGLEYFPGYSGCDNPDAV